MLSGVPTLMVSSGWEVALGYFSHVPLDATMSIPLKKEIVGGLVIDRQPILFLACG